MDFKLGLPSYQKSSFMTFYLLKQQLSIISVISLSAKAVIYYDQYRITAQNRLRTVNEDK